LAKVGRDVDNTIAKTPITFAMIELAESPDCNDRKRQWMNYGFKDVTPKFAGRATVPSLNDGNVTDGRDMLTQMASVDADWYMLSGHHGALYESDYNTFTAGTQIDFTTLMNDQDFCGFFNEAYHSGRWEHSTRMDPTPAAVTAKLQAHEIYLRTSPVAASSIAPFSQTNPWLDATHVTPKGIIISACNTLIYKIARTTWSAAFPNAVIFGAVSRINQGVQITNAIASAKMTDETFWRDPQSILDQPGNSEELSKQLTAGFPRSHIIGFVYKQKLFWSGFDNKGRWYSHSKAVGDPLIFDLTTDEIS